MSVPLISQFSGPAICDPKIKMPFFHGKIELKEIRNCFVSLPAKWTSMNFRSHPSGLIVMKLIFLDDIKCDRFVYVNWNGSKNSTENSVFLDQKFGRALAVRDQESVLVQAVDDYSRIPAATKCLIMPLTPDDYHLIQIHHGAIEQQFMDQLRIITTAFLKENLFNVFPLWLKELPNVPIFIKICNAQPANKAGLILTNDTEVVVKNPGDQMEEEQEQEAHGNGLKSVFGLIRSLIPNQSVDATPISRSSPVSEVKNSTISVPIYRGKQLLLRVILSKEEITQNGSPCTGIVSSKHLTGIKENYCLIKLKRIDTTKLDPPPELPNDVESADKSPEEKICTKFVREYSKICDSFNESYVLVIGSDNCPPDSIMLNRAFIAQRSLPFLSYVNAESTVDTATHLSVSILDRLILIPMVGSPRLVGDNQKIQQRFEQKIQKSPIENNLLVYNGLIMDLGGKDFLVFHPPQQNQDLELEMSRLLSSCFVVNRDTKILIQNVNLNAGVSILSSRLVKNWKIVDSMVTRMLAARSKPFGGQQDTMERCMHLIRDSFNTTKRTARPSCILITGPKGGGKTILVEKLLYECYRTDSIWNTVIRCATIKGKRIESLQKLFSNTLIDAVQHEPSIVVVEDLHQIAYDVGPDKAAPDSSDSSMPENSYCERVAYLFGQITESLQQMKSNASYFSRVIIVATSDNSVKLHPMFLKLYAFDETIEMPALDSKRRAAIFEEILKNKEYSLPGKKEMKTEMKIDVRRLGRKTKDLNAQQLAILVDMIIHSALVDVLRSPDGIDNGKPIEINDDHADEALSKMMETKPNLKLNTKKSLKDVGGLERVKQLFQDIIMLQVKHPNLYRQLPLKLPNSMLLYGMPGTGKTLIVNAMANESDLNFISVKGPELLSKYIGASEQSVRRIFKQAQSMAPCLLFFDEFDSLAPKRGHDSTGVTDRVVNQMLTLLDGLEAMGTGIFVMAATSRPDLIDLALLRPGRFDRTVRCDLPDANERREILLALIRNLPIKIEQSSDSILDQLIKSTENFTGADLQAMVYNAYLNSSKNALNNNQSESIGMVFTWENILEARKQIEPSLSESQRKRFNKIYERFEAELAGGSYTTSLLENYSEDTRRNQTIRATLA